MLKNQDFEFFEENLPLFLEKHDGEFVVIKNKTAIDFYKSYEDALKSAVKAFGNEEFLIQEITTERRVNYINSDFLIKVA